MRGRGSTLLGFVLLFLRGRGPRRARLEGERIVPDGAADGAAELAVVGLLLAAAGCAVAFIVIYALRSLPDQTQLLGASLGIAFLLLAGAAIVASRHLVVTEQLEESYPAREHPEEQERVAQIVAQSGSRLSRRRLLSFGLGAAGGSVGLALLAPLVSLGPVFDMAPFYATPWYRGRRLVDVDNRPYHASDIDYADFYTAFPEGANKEELASPLILVRLTASQLHLPPANAGYAAHGIVAYSKICTHAACAISLYRAPLFQPDEPKPAFVCPCHYSTFDPATGGTVIYGPAGRKLPMLPLTIDATGVLRANGNFDEPVGPSWWGVRMEKPT